MPRPAAASLASVTVSALLVVAGVIHLLPLPGALGAGTLARLYGLDPAALADPNLALLLRHRAVLFGVVGLLLVAAAFDATLRRPALVTGFVSAGAFLVLAQLERGTNAQLGRVVAADVVALACLLAAAAADGLAQPRGAAGT